MQRKEGTRSQSALVPKWKVRVSIAAAIWMVCCLFILGILCAPMNEFAHEIERADRAHFDLSAQHLSDCNASRTDPELKCTPYPAYCKEAELGGPILKFLDKYEALALPINIVAEIKSAHASLRVMCDDREKEYLACVYATREWALRCREMEKLLNISPHETALTFLCYPPAWDRWVLCGLFEPSGGRQYSSGWHHYSSLVILGFLLLLTGACAFCVVQPAIAPSMALVFCSRCIKINGESGRSTNGVMYEINPRCCCLRWVFKEQIAFGLSQTADRANVKSS